MQGRPVIVGDYRVFTSIERRFCAYRGPAAAFGCARPVWLLTLKLPNDQRMVTSTVKNDNTVYRRPPAIVAGLRFEIRRIHRN
jgi:hypothetical protein